MPVTRMRMRPWLEKKIDSNSIAGLVWVDKEKKVFSIPWKHAARHGWQMDKDASIFKQWAIHTGKFKQGETDPDPKTWKANFRCAMNSLPDIEEVKDKSVNRGCDAVRVYRMLHVCTKVKDKKSKSRESKRRNKSSKVKREESSYSDSSCSENNNDNNNNIDNNNINNHSSSHSSTRAYDDTTTQECTVDSTNAAGLCDAFMDQDEVPHYSVSVDVVSPDPDSTCPHYAFQVSPDHSPAYAMDIDALETDAIIEITQQLEQEHSQWSQGKVFLTNGYYSSESFPSPTSEWSNISGEELELRLYTELDSRPASFEDMLSCTDSCYSQQISCQY